MTSLSTVRLYRQYIHPVMATLSTGLLTLASVLLARDALALPVAPVAVMLLLVAVGVVEALAGNISAELRSDQSGRVRELVVLVILGYLIGLGLSEGGLGARLVPGLRHGVYMATAALHWTSAARLHGYLRQREDYLSSVAEKNAGEVRSIIRGSRGYTTEVYRSLQRARGQVLSFFVFVTIGFVILWALGLGESGPALSTGPAPGSAPTAAPATILVYVAAGLATAVVVFATNLFIEEYQASADGLLVTRRFERRRLVAAAALIGAGALVAVAAGSNSSLLDLSIVAVIAEWLSGVFSRAPTDPGNRLPNVDFFQNFPSAADALGVPPESLEISRFWETFAVVFRWTVIGVFVAAILAFLAAPFITRQFQRDLRRAGLRRRFRNAGVRFLILLWRSWRRTRRLFRALFTRRPTEREELGPATRGGASASTYIHHQPPPQLRRQRTNLRSLYKDLVEWAGRQGLSHPESETVLEFTRRLESSFPGTCTRAPEAGSILTAALYAPSPLPRQELTRYREVVRDIVKTEEPG